MQRWTTIPVPYEAQDAQQFIARMTAMGPGWRLGRNPGWVISRVPEPRAYDGFIDLRIDERRSAEIGYSGRAVGARPRTCDHGSPAGLPVCLRARRPGPGVLVRRRRQRRFPPGRRECRIPHPARRSPSDAAHKGRRAGGRLGWRSAPDGPAVSIEIAAGAIQLRPWTLDDAPELLPALDDPEIQLWNPFVLHRRRGAGGTASRGSRRGRTTRVRRLVGRYATLSVAPCWGQVSLFNINRDQRDAEVGYWLLPHARGRGVGTTAVLAVTRYAFGALELLRLQLFHAVENTASCALATRAGFAYEGTHRQSHRYGDRALARRAQSRQARQRRPELSGQVTALDGDDAFQSEPVGHAAQLDRRARWLHAPARRLRPTQPGRAARRPAGRP